MKQEKIDKYVDNLDVNTQVDLLKKVLNLLINFGTQPVNYIEETKYRAETKFIEEQINEFDKQFRSD
mgnify:CR=1 FL=1